MANREQDWVDAFEKYLEPRKSPYMFRRWSAITAIAGILERKVWMNIWGDTPSYPSMYTVLVAGPGIGKSVATSAVQNLWKFLEKEEGYHAASDSLTKAAFVDELEAADRHVNLPEGTVSYNSLLVVSNELGVLLPEYDRSFMSVLTELWDNRGYSEYRRTTGKKMDILKATVTMLVATQPSFLNDSLPPGAWDQGFLARTLLIYSGDKQKRKLFTATGMSEELREYLYSEARKITKLYGPMKLEKEAAESIEAWNEHHEEDAPSHPKLVHYTERRPAHLLKLCIIASIARSDEMIIRMEDFTRALSWLMEAEIYMPDIFKAMAKNSDMVAIDETWYACYKLYKRHNDAPVPESKVHMLLSQKAPVHSVGPLLALMERGQILKRVQIKTIGTCFIPAEYTRRKD